MKKFLLPFLTLALTVVSFISCSSNDDDNSKSSDKNTYVVTYRIADGMAELGDYKVTISDGTKTSEYDIVKSGKQGTYNFGSDISKEMMSGYEYTLTQQSDKALTFTVTYTPNDKAKALTETDKADVCYGYEYYSNKIRIGYSNRINIGVKGNNVINRINYAVKEMSK